MRSGSTTAATTTTYTAPGTSPFPTAAAYTTAPAVTAAAVTASLHGTRFTLSGTTSPMIPPIRI